MKKTFIGVALLFIALTSCSTSDDTTSGTSSFLPLTATSAWVYDVKLDTQNSGRDSLYVNGESNINGVIYQKLKTKATPVGFYTNILNNNNLRKDGDKLLLTGTTGLGLSAILPLTLELVDFVIFKENASAGTDLEAMSGTFQQDMEGVPLKVDYTFKSVFKESLTTFTVPGKDSYTNVKVIKLVANLSVSTTYLLPIINTPVSIPLITAQDVIVSTQYYAEGVGMVYAKTDIQYTLNDLPAAVELPIPQEGSTTIEEFLD